MSCPNNYLNTGGQPTLPATRLESDSLGTSALYSSTLAQAVSDPAPTTTVVPGSETDASAKLKAPSERPIQGGPGSAAGTAGGRRREQKRTLLTEREGWILRLCYEHQFISSFVLRKTVFKDRSKRTVERALASLVDKGLLLRLTKRLLAGQGVYVPTRLGWNLGQSLSPFEIPRIGVKEPTFEHEELLLETRIHLERLLGGSWHPEGALRSENYAEMPDGVLELPTDQKIAVEIENSDKGFKRYHALMSRWAASSVSLVLYVVTNPKVESALRRALQSLGASNLAMISMDQIRTGDLEVEMASGRRRLKGVQG